MDKKEVFESAKAQIGIHIDTLRKLGVWDVETEIELVHFVRNYLKQEVE